MSHVCPQCATPVEPAAESCSKCSAKFDTGSAWKPVLLEVQEASNRRGRRVAWLIIVALVGGPIAGMLIASSAGAGNVAFAFGLAMYVIIPLGLISAGVVAFASRGRR